MTPDDYRATRLAPERLLLHVQITQPDDTCQGLFFEPVETGYTDILT
ncbi:MAG: hypothetical protein ACE148_03075 [Vicinamibacterales bacterium]